MRVMRLSGWRAGAVGLSWVVLAACGGDDPPASGGFGEDGAAGTTAGGSTGSAGRGGTAGSSAQAGASQNGGSAGASTAGSGGGSAANGGADAVGGGGAGGSAQAGTSGNGPGGNGVGASGPGGNGPGGNGPGGNGSGGNGTGGNGTGNAGNGMGGHAANPPLDFGGAGGQAGETGAFGSCKGVADWGSNVSESLSTDGDDWLGAITPDERTIVYFVEKGGTKTLRVADRASANDPWGAPVEITGGPFARDRVALESTGLVLGVLAADRRSFVELRRASRSVPFAPSNLATFHNLEVDLPEGATLADPVIGEGDRALFLSVIAAGTTSSVQYALRFDVTAIWSTRTPTTEPELAANGDKRRHPTGLSADGRTLFFWDDGLGKLRRGVRAVGPIAKFDAFTDVGFQQAAAPVTSCKRIYYSLKTTDTFDLFHADSL